MRTGGRGKHNFLSGGAFRKAKYEKLRWRKKKRRKRGRAKIPFPQPPSFLPAKARGEAPSEANHAVNKLWWRWWELNPRSNLRFQIFELRIFERFQIFELRI